ncbi:NUDIX hydrolase [Pedobacter sp. AW1-32]|uniref:NUDIX hydrolase n=1 Tax=Pedobacter sp. AW1-32 TaxID=3383026 RepID=UPI003FEEE8B0
MKKYSSQIRYATAVDCIVFGFDGDRLKILLVKRDFAPAKDSWSLMGGFAEKDESLDTAAGKVLKKLTGLEGVYLEQLKAYSEPDRDPIERTISIAYFALIDINRYQTQLNHDYHAEWFDIKEMPSLIFDHNEMVADAQARLRYKAALHPILFELLPKKFTIPQLQNLYEGVYDNAIDNRNFIRKITSTGLLIKLAEKDKSSSKKGAFYFKLDKKKYKDNFQAFLSLIPNRDKFIG